jgi:hypothetical protein
LGWVPSKGNLCEVAPDAPLVVIFGRTDKNLSLQNLEENISKQTLITIAETEMQIE